MVSITTRNVDALLDEVCLAHDAAVRRADEALAELRAAHATARSCFATALQITGTPHDPRNAMLTDTPSLEDLVRQGGLNPLLPHRPAIAA
jgi:hypothetical protein